MRDVVIVSACRTAIGAFGGTLKSLNGAVLASVTLLHALKKKGKTLGLATLCGGGGVSMACALEMVC